MTKKIRSFTATCPKTGASMTVEAWGINTDSPEMVIVNSTVKFPKGGVWQNPSPLYQEKLALHYALFYECAKALGFKLAEGRTIGDDFRAGKWVFEK